jgi:hypothetical protein
MKTPTGKVSVGRRKQGEMPLENVVLRTHTRGVVMLSTDTL